MVAHATPFESLKAATALAGSQSALARICGVSQTAVWKWLQSGKRLPAEHVLKVEAETGVSRHLLRPDIYPAGPSAPLSGGSVTSAGPVVACDRPAFLQRGAA